MAIDVNMATQKELINLKGINTEIADAILHARPFSTLEELLSIPGIGQKTLNRLREQGLVVISHHLPSEPGAKPATAQSLPITEPTVDERRITPFLTLKEPAAETLVEFREVFAVPMDDFYNSLYLNTSFDKKSVIGTGSKKKSRRLTLDFRPKRWYRQYKQISKELEFAEKDVGQAQTRLEAAEEKLASLGDTEYREWGEEVVRRRQISRQAIENRNSLIDRKTLILREIKTNGYEIVETNIPSSIVEQGYDFYILGHTSEGTEYKPIVLKPISDYSDNKKWATIEAKLSNVVQSNPAFSKAEKKRYTEEAAKLKSYKDNTELTGKCNRLLLEIENQKRLKLTLEADYERQMKQAKIKLEQQLNDLQAKANDIKAEVQAHAERALSTISNNRDRDRMMQEVEEQANELHNALADKGNELKDQYNQYREELQSSRIVKTKEINQKIEVFKNHLKDLEKNGLANLRQKFFNHWNNPPVPSKSKSAILYPDQDPFTEFLVSLKPPEDENVIQAQIHYFEPTPNGFRSRRGISLEDVIGISEVSDDDLVAILPAFERQGRISNETLVVVVNPQHSVKKPELPIIKFVETYVIKIRWKGYGLGELNHSCNLFPGEVKEIVIEKQTKLAKKMSETAKREEVMEQKLTSSFEDNIQEVFSTKEQEANSKNDKRVEATSSEQREELGIAAGFEISAQMGPVEAGASFDMSYKNSSALMTSQQMDSQTANNQAKESMKKNVSNAVKKTASDTSARNKLEVTAVTSEEREETLSQKETIRLENPNIGRTVNYNFFQLQNLYETSVRLTDVQIVVDSGLEVLAHSGVNDLRAFGLEEFGKIYANYNPDDPRSAILSGIVARQVMKHYLNCIPGLTTGNGALQVDNSQPLDQTVFEILNFSESSSESDNWEEEKLSRLKEALTYLKRIPFIFRETQLVEKSIEAVNAGAYYLEAEVGARPATEKYLEDRRDIETERQQAIVKHLKAQTDAKVFFPEGVSNFTLTSESKEEQQPTISPEKGGEST